MIEPYAETLLKQHFPSERAPTPDVFELAIACCGGTSTGAYVGGVLDFLWEAFEAWRLAASAGEAPNHQVRIRYLTGASAGGLSVGMALLTALKTFPHVYDDALWRTYYPDGETPQEKDKNPHYCAWVTEIGLAKMLSHPEEVESGEIFVFHDCGPKNYQTVLSLAANAPPAGAPRDWVCDPLEVRVTIGNLRGIAYALDFNRGVDDAVPDEYFVAHRDCVGFAASTSQLGGVPTGLGPAPDCHELSDGAFDGAPSPTPALDQARAVFKASMVATSAIPLAFPIQSIPQNPLVYQWRSAYWDVARGVPVVDEPIWPTSTPSPVTFDATDGGLFDNQPFDIAHQRLAGVLGRNPQEADKACRAVLLIDPLAQDPPKPRDPNPSSLFGVVARLILSPVDQDRLDTLDLAQIKEESVYSRFIIAPSRRNPLNPDHAWTPSLSLMGAPMNALFGFTASPYREHDFLLGRRNAQKFLRDIFVLPATNPLVQGAGWGPQDEFVEAGVTYRRLVPLRGRAADLQPEPEWKWQALSDASINEYVRLARARADAIFRNISAAASADGGLKGLLIRFYLNVGWCFARRGLGSVLRTALTQARAGLDPSDPARVAKSPPAPPPGGAA